jgi:hypothetical protein
MNMNQIIQQLYTSNDPWITYTQRIYLLNPFLDSAYNNHIVFEKDYIQLTIPQQIDVIHNLRTTFDEKNVYIFRDSSLTLVKHNFLFNERKHPIVLRFPYPQSLDHTIEFSATIFKKSVKTQLSKL